VLELLREAGMPEPSLVLCSGQGLYLTWLHYPVGWKEIPSWQDCQYKLWRILKPLGADPRARDGARVHRLVGTMNSKNGGPVYALRDAGPRRPFEELAASILQADLVEDEEQPVADLYDLRAQRATRRDYKAPRLRTERSLWLARWVDLQALRRLRYGGEQMEDFRDRWLFVAGVALSWITDPPEPAFFERELLGLAEEWGGWDEGRSRSKLQAVLERVRMVAGGQTVTWQGIEIDPRYRFRTQTLVEWLEITAAEQRDMFNHIGASEKRRRNTESRREKRRAAGSQPRTQYDQARKLSHQNDCATAHHLRQKFHLSTTEIGQIMGKSARTVRRWLE
jgi:DNA-binding transcriptional regulator YiaG